MLSEQITDKLIGIPTPFYFYDTDLLERTLIECLSSAGEYGFKVHFALKANFDEKIVSIIRSHGLGADCVSGNEVRFAIRAGFNPESIVFAGVGKTDDEILYSLEKGIFAFNCESRQELEVINSLAGSVGKKANVALRINPDVDPMTHRHISTGQADSKFGISYREIDQLCSELNSLNNINVTGLHFHIGSQIIQMRVFEYLCKRINTIRRWFEEKGFRFSHLNVGGGLGVEYTCPEKEPVPDFRTYFSVFDKYLERDDSLEIHFELGRSLTAQCGELVTKVLYGKTTAEGKNVVIVDTSMTDLMRPALYGSTHAIQNLTAHGPRTTYTIGGTVCESTDILARDIDLPFTRRGDLLTIKSVGAYGVSMASRYNLHEPARSVYSEDL